MLRKILVLCTAVLIVLLSNTVFGEDSTKTETGQPQVKYAGVFQVTADTLNKSFSISYAKLFVNGQIGKKLSFGVELVSRSGNPLDKAFLDYQVVNLLKVRLGQFSNPFKFAEPPPEEKYFVYYALITYYLSNADDIGFAVLGKTNLISYYFCVINGTGRNVPDNNTSKDIVGHISIKPINSLEIQLCWQGGRQLEGWRDGKSVYLSFLPIQALSIQSAFITRRDFGEHGEYGWYVTGLYNISRNVQLTARVHELTQHDKSVWTIGTQIFANQYTKVQPNIILGKARSPKYVLLVQLFLK